MAEQVAAVAKAENRTISGLFREAFRNYRAQRIHTLLDESERQGLVRNHNGHMPEDIEGLIHDVRVRERSQ